MDKEFANWPDDRIFRTFCTYCERLAFFDMLNDAIVIVAATSGAIMFMNERARAMYGYGMSETAALGLDDIAAGTGPGLGRTLTEITAAGSAGLVFSAIRRRKSGELFPVGVSARQMRLHGTEIVAFLERDLTADLATREEVILAGKVQQGMLPPDFANERVAVATVYQPHHHVSGDIYDYKWHAAGAILAGYVADVMGHGVATAIRTAALQVHFRRALETGEPPDGQLAGVNAAAAGCFAADSFAAAIMFAADFDQGVLHYAAAGINHFIVYRDGSYRVEKSPGLFLGITPEEEFTACRLCFRPGDGFVFLSDGLFELLPAPDDYPGSFEAMGPWLRQVAARTGRRDDAAALCLMVK